MKALILYFSGTGGTKYAAQLIKKELNKLEIETELHGTEENISIEAGNYDLLVLGCPKYYECPTLDFINYIKKNLPESRQVIPTMMFVTQAGNLGTNWNGISRILAKKGLRLVVGKSFAVANNMMIFSFFSSTDEKSVRANIEKIRNELPAVLNCLIKGKQNIESVGTFKSIMEKLVAVLCTKLFPVFFMKYSVSEHCTGCSLCAKNCPKGNIVMNGRRPVFGKECMFCMRCINSCPSNAILYNKKQCPQYKLPDSKTVV